MDEGSDILQELIKQKQEFDQSLKYASYIQKALLPSSFDLQQTLPKHCLFYKPRDIVSGDFYWIHKNGNLKTIAVGDSTGHGVPGAFLSILGISFLNLIQSKFSPKSPAMLLNILREYIMKALNQTGGTSEQKDGIDLSVCIIDTDTNTLSYSGAFNPLYIVRDSELIQLQGDKMPVGVGADYEESFENKTVSIQENDFIYLFSDGFPDQFGGPDGKKYKYPRFRELLKKCASMDVKDQFNILTNEFETWKGTLAQLDDITILGFLYTHE